MRSPNTNQVFTGPVCTKPRPLHVLYLRMSGIKYRNGGQPANILPSGQTWAAVTLHALLSEKIYSICCYIAILHAV